MGERKGRREWKVSWLREGNSQPRAKRTGTSEKRARSYLAAVTATSPEERYGDKVDQRWCCEGGSGDGITEPYEPCYRNCNGETWRERWQNMYGSVAPLVWAKIESRPVNPWDTVLVVLPLGFKFGDIVKMRDDRSTSGLIRVKKDRRLMAINGSHGTVVVAGDGGHDEGHIQQISIGVWETTDG